MTLASSDSRLGIAYGVGLVLHGLILGFLAIVGAWGAMMTAGMANSMRWNVVAGAITLVTTLLPGVPSVFALLSWWILRRRAQRPSRGHMGLTIASAIGIWALFAIVMVTT